MSQRPQPGPARGDQPQAAGPGGHAGQQPVTWVWHAEGVRPQPGPATAVQVHGLGVVAVRRCLPAVARHPLPFAVAHYRVVGATQ